MLLSSVEHMWTIISTIACHLHVLTPFICTTRTSSFNNPLREITKQIRVSKIPVGHVQEVFFNMVYDLKRVGESTLLLEVYSQEGVERSVVVKEKD